MQMSYLFFLHFQIFEMRGKMADQIEKTLDSSAVKKPLYEQLGVSEYVTKIFKGIPCAN